MSSKTRYYKIGVFVILGFILTVIGVIVFGAGKFFRKSITVETYFNQSVQGLDVGAPLKLQGVQIGNVKEIGFAFNRYNTTRTYVLVRAEVYQESVGARKSLGRIPTAEERISTVKELIEKGLRLQLDSSGITGVAFLNMVYLDPKRYPPLEIDWQPESLYIPSAPGTITVVTQAIENLTRQLESIDIKGITNKVDQLLATTNRAVEEAQIAAVSQDIRRLLGKLENNSKNFNSILESKEVQQSLKDLSQAMENLSNASQEFPKTMAGLNGSLREVNRLTSTQGQQLNLILEDLRSTSENLRELSDTAKRYPSWVLFGNPPPHLDKVKK
jgi:phospholipid/cholesterol/gamma-HCH transport system substrate-binding protein